MNEQLKQITRECTTNLRSMMKKANYVLTIMAIFFSISLSSCGSDNNDEPDASIPTSIDVLVGRNFMLGAKGNWYSSNDFIASVTNDGVVFAKHVGECVIEGAIGRKKYYCTVTVNPTSTLIQEPITEWNMSKPQLIAKCGQDYVVSGKSIGYITNNNIAPIVLYLFDDSNKLSSSAVTVKTSYTSELVNFLTERYQVIGRDGYDFFFANGSNQQSITTVVGVQRYSYDRNYWVVMYMPYNDSRSIDMIDINANIPKWDLD